MKWQLRGFESRLRSHLLAVAIFMARRPKSAGVSNTLVCALHMPITFDF